VHELVTMIVRGLVGDPGQVTVNEVEGESSIIFEVRVAHDGLTKVMGKGGRTANALRTLVRAAGTKEHKSVWVGLDQHGEAPELAD